MMNPLSLKKINFNVISGVYFLFNNSELVYVGQSENIVKRIHEHTDKLFTHYSHIKCSKKELLVLEKKYIQTYNPVYNINLKNKTLEISAEIEDVMIRTNNIGLFKNNKFHIKINEINYSIVLLKNKHGFCFTNFKGFFKTQGGYGEITVENKLYFIVPYEHGKYKLVSR